MSRSQFNKSKPAVSKALILCILMIISSISVMLNEEIISESRYLDATTEILETSGQSYLTDGTFNNYQAGIFQTQIEKISTDNKGTNVCVLIYNATPICWGSNYYNDNYVNSWSPSEINLNSYSIDEISNKGTQICAVMDGDLFCWGQLNGYGTVPISSPIQIQLLGDKKVSSFTAIGGLNIAMMEDNTIQCWGYLSGGYYGLPLSCTSNTNDDYWQINTLSSSPGSWYYIPSSVSSINYGNQTQLAGDLAGGCHLSEDNMILCWGNELRYSSSSSSDYYRGTIDTAEFSVGEKHACYVDSGGVFCWGKQDHGVLGNGYTSGSCYNSYCYTSNYLAPNDFGGISVIDVAVNPRSSCVVLADGTVKCWGSNIQCLSSSSYSSSSPVNIPLGGNHLAKEIYMGYNSIFVITTEDKLLSCGSYSGHSSYGTTYMTSFNELSLFSSQRYLFENEAEGKFMILDPSGNEVDLTGYTIDVDMPFGLSVNSTTFEIEGSAKYFTTNTNWQVDIYNATHHWTLDYELEIIQDTDGDQIPNDEDTDDDNDGFPDTIDGCVLQSGNSILDSIGCPDNDGDGWSNNGDSFPNDDSQYSDIDGDGYGDNATGTRADDCKNDYGDSNRNGTFGCPDDDYDGWANIDDLFPDDSSQWLDFDGDGFGDQLLGIEGDYCPNQ